MKKLQRVLLIDDEYEQIEEEIAADFQEQGIDIRFCATKDEAIELLDSGIHLDLVILDWFLEEENNLLSRLVLKHLQTIAFLPVFIWSNHITNYTESRERGEIAYPLIEDIAKDDVTAELVQEKVSSWFENSLTAQISSLYRQQIWKGVEKIFFNLANIPNQDIASLLKFLVGDGTSVDWSHDFILNLLHRHLIGEKDFCDRLRALLRSTESIEEQGNPAERRTVLNKVLYYTTEAQFVRCGDMIRFQTGDEHFQLGIVVTPACDLANQNTRFLELIELQALWDDGFNLKSKTKKTIAQYNHPSFYFFPSVALNDELTDLAAVLKAKIVLEHQFPEANPKYPGTSKRMEYADTFVFKSKEVKLEFVCRLDNPYKSDFLQKLHSHNSRVGTPDIKRLL